MRNTSDTFGWKEASPVVGFVFKITDQSFDTALMDILAIEEFKMNDNIPPKDSDL